VVAPADPRAVRRHQLHLDEDDYDEREHAESSDATPAESASTSVGIGGMLLGAASLAVPAVGPVLAAGPLLAGMAAAGAGAGPEELPQRLGEVGVPPKDAERYVHAVGHGRTLVVLSADERQVDDAASILARHAPSEPDEPHTS